MGKFKVVGGVGFDYAQAVGSFEVRWDKGRNKKQYRVLQQAIEKYQSIEETAQVWDLSEYKPILLEEKSANQ